MRAPSTADAHLVRGASSAPSSAVSFIMGPPSARGDSSAPSTLGSFVMPLPSSATNSGASLMPAPSRTPSNTGSTLKRAPSAADSYVMRGTLPHFLGARSATCTSGSSVAPSLRRIEVLSPFYFPVAKDYDYTLPTWQNYKTESDVFFGNFKDIRATRDRVYHSNYVKERQALQDVLVRDVTHGGSPQEKPWIVFTAGAMGAGKSHVINWMSAQGHFPLPNIVQVDPDAFRERLPEWKTYIETNPGTAGRLTHRECGYCVELAQEAAMQQSKNVWVDGSLRDREWYQQVFEDLRKRHAKYRIAILHIHASEEAVLARARDRAVHTGRHVPEEDLLKSLRDVPTAVEGLTPAVDFYAKISNEPGQIPKLLKFSNELVCKVTATGDDWDEVRERFGLDSSEAQVRKARAAITEMLSRHTVFLITRSYCSFCHNVKARLKKAKVKFESVDIDLLPDAVLIHTEAAHMSGSRTTPMVFVRGVYLGGCDKTIGLIESGKLQEMLRPSTPLGFKRSRESNL